MICVRDFCQEVMIYMVKPVNVNEMVLRVGALLRRAQILSAHKIIIGSTEFDYDQMTVKIGSEIQVLPKKEFLLLYKLQHRQDVHLQNSN